MRSKKNLKQTPSQTAGPYLHIGCIPNKIGINSSFTVSYTHLRDHDTEPERVCRRKG